MINEAKLECMECGKKFTKKLTSKTTEVKCPKCKSTDVEVISESIVRRINLLLNEDGDADIIVKNLKHSDDPDDMYDEEELEMGIEVEKEHNDDEKVSKAIAKAHLAEIPDYYTRLKKMERAAMK